MQTCTKCHHQSPDVADICEECGAELAVYSEYALALQKYRANPRVRGVRIAVNDDACPVCRQLRGSYPLDQVPALPAKGCSSPLGCNCHYEPWLNAIYP